MLAKSLRVGGAAVRAAGSGFRRACLWGWSTDSVTDSRTGTDGRRANGSRFGLGGVVHAAGCGFRGACPWGKTVHE